MDSRSLVLMSGLFYLVVRVVSAWLLDCDERLGESRARLSWRGVEGQQLYLTIITLVPTDREQRCSCCYGLISILSLSLSLCVSVCLSVCLLSAVSYTRLLPYTHTTLPTAAASSLFFLFLLLSLLVSFSSFFSAFTKFNYSNILSPLWRLPTVTLILAWQTASVVGRPRINLEYDLGIFLGQSPPH